VKGYGDKGLRRCRDVVERNRSLEELYIDERSQVKFNPLPKILPELANASG
jgi:hypothetical protein